MVVNSLDLSVGAFQLFINAEVDSRRRLSSHAGRSPQTASNRCQPLHAMVEDAGKGRQLQVRKPAIDWADLYDPAMDEVSESSSTETPKQEKNGHQRDGFTEGWTRIYTSSSPGTYHDWPFFNDTTAGTSGSWPGTDPGASDHPESRRRASMSGRLPAESDTGGWWPGTYPKRVWQCAKMLNSVPANESIRRRLDKWRDRLSPMEMNSVLKQLQRWERAVEFVDWMAAGGDADVATYTLLLRCMARCRQWARVALLVDEIVAHADVELDNMAFCTLISMAARQRNLSEARRYFSLMKALGCPPDLRTYNAMANGFARVADHLSARALLREMRESGVEPDRITHSALLSAYGAAGKKEEAQKCFREMEQSGIEPDLVAYSILIDILGKCGDADSALGAFRALQGSGLRCDTASWNAVLHGMAKAARVDQMEALLDEMRGSGCQLDTITYSTMLWAYAATGRRQLAESMLRRMEDGAEGATPDEFCYAALLSGLAAAGEWDEAVGSFQEMRARGCQVGPAVYSLMINVLSKLARADEAEALFGEMKAQGLRPNAFVYSCLMDMHGKGRHISRAVQLLGEMRNAGCAPTVVVYNTLIHAFRKNGDLARAEAVFGEMRADGVAPDQVTYSAVISAMGKAGKYLEAIQLFQEMRLSGVQVDQVLYGTMVDLYARAGQLEDAILLFEEMQAAGMLPDGVMYLSVVELYWKAGRKEEAKKLWLTLKESGVSALPMRSSSPTHFLTNIKAKPRKKRKQKQEVAMAPVEESKGPSSDVQSLGHVNGVSVEEIVHGRFRNEDMLRGSEQIRALVEFEGCSGLISSELEDVEDKRREVVNLDSLK